MGENKVLAVDNILDGDLSLFANLIDSFPYAINVYTRDGMTVMVNRALLRDYNLKDSRMLVGKYRKHFINL